MKKLVFSLLFCFGFFLVLEGLAGQFTANDKLLLPDPDEIWRQPYGTRTEHGVEVRINKMGLRGPDIGDKQYKRVATVGDSSIFGFLVNEDETFSAKIVQNLNSQGLEVEHINAAAPGHSTFQSLSRLKWVLPSVKPDVLIVGNLWSDSALAGFQDADLYHSNTFVFLTKSALFRYLISLLYPDQYTVIRWHARPEDTAGIPPRVSLEEYRLNLLRIHDLAAQHGCRTVFLGLYLEEEPQDVPEDMASQYRSQMKAISHLKNTVFLDAKDAWEGKTDLFADFLHPNAKGHLELGNHFTPDIKALLKD